MGLNMEFDLQILTRGFQYPFLQFQFFFAHRELNFGEHLVFYILKIALIIIILFFALIRPKKVISK